MSDREKKPKEIKVKEVDDGEVKGMVKLNIDAVLFDADEVINVNKKTGAKEYDGKEALKSLAEAFQPIHIREGKESKKTSEPKKTTISKKSKTDASEKAEKKSTQAKKNNKSKNEER